MWLLFWCFDGPPISSDCYDVDFSRTPAKPKVEIKENAEIKLSVFYYKGMF